MSTKHNPAGSPYYLRLFLAEVPPGTSTKAKSGSPAVNSGTSRPESVLARKLTAKALEFYLGHTPSPESLASETRTPEGKPYFQDYTDFHYNANFDFIEALLPWSSVVQQECMSKNKKA